MYHHGRLIASAITSLMVLNAPAAWGAGFALSEQSASGLGNAFAGAAAVAEDASTLFFNPAGMTYLQGTQLVGAIHLIQPSAHFNDQGSTPASNTVPGPMTFTYTGGEGGDLGGLAVLPNLYYKRALNDNLQFGLGITSPFGLKTEYDKDWIGRFQGIKSELKTININPALAFKLNEQLSLGIGVSAMWAKAELTNAVNYITQTGHARVQGDDWGFGFNLGAIYQVTPETRLGVAYRSKVEQHLKGDAHFSVANPLLPDGKITADVTLPETVSFSSFSQLNDRWDLLADVTWTRWSQFKELAIYRTSGAVLGTPTQEHWHNTLRYALGLNYSVSPQLKLRSGIAFDEEAISAEYRTVRIPGNDRTWLSLGASWKAGTKTTLDISYAHLWIKDASIDDDQTATTPTPSKGRLLGTYRGHADILSLQWTHQF